MSKASEQALGELHGAVAQALTGIIRDGVVLGATEEGEPIKTAASASYFAAAISLLKNNNITADPETNKALNELRDQLAKSRQDRKGNLASKTDAAALLERQLGDMTQ